MASAHRSAELEAWAEAESETWRGQPIGRVHTRLTRNGLHMAFVALFAVLGGAIRSFNLLVILAGLLISILLMQWRFARGTLPGLTVSRQLPQEAFAGIPFKVRFQVTNHRRWLPAWLIRLEDAIGGPRLPARGARAGCAVSITHPGSTETTSYECVITRRGRYRFGPVRLTTAFPFGLIRAWKNTRTHTNFVVFPQLARLQNNWTGMIENRREGLAASRHTSGPNEGEFFGIRNWQSGDSRRWIHWRTTARIGELAVRQFEQRNRTQLSLMLDPYSAISGEEDDAKLEWAISVAAAMVIDVASLATSRLAFCVADNSERVLVSHRSSHFRRAALQTLATTKPLAEPDLAAGLVRLLGRSNPRWPIVIVSPRAPDLESLAVDAEGNRLMSPGLLNRLDIIWIDVMSDAAKRIAVPRVKH